MYMWDIFTLTSYFLFILNSDLIRCPEFYLVTLRHQRISLNDIWKGKEWKSSKSETTINMEGVNIDNGWRGVPIKHVKACLEQTLRL